ncbi:MAG: hypothetical protein ACKOZX_14710 [Gammaproteobacteria bacterium]
MTETIEIPFRFRGPPGSGNGGYVAGAIAERFASPRPMAADQAIEVTLRAPIPLDTPMRVLRPAPDQVRVELGDTLIAEAARTTLADPVPQPPAFADALAAQAQSPSFYRGVNPFLPDGTGFHPVCACCGADTADGEGLKVYAAPVPGFAGVAAAWRPHPALADASGALPDAIIWTALDCPGQFAYYVAGIRTGLLGRMTARLLRPVFAARDLVVIGWCQSIEGRKHFAGTALYDETGALCAFSRQTWIGRMD